MSVDLASGLCTMSDAASAALSCSASALFTFAKHVVAFPILGCAGSLGALSAVDASGSLYVLCPFVTLCCGGIGAVHGACNAVHVIVVESGLVPRIAKELIPQLESERGVEELAQARKFLEGADGGFLLRTFVRIALPRPEFILRSIIEEVQRTEAAKNEDARRSGAGASGGGKTIVSTDVVAGAARGVIVFHLQSTKGRASMLGCAAIILASCAAIGLHKLASGSRR